VLGEAKGGATRQEESMRGPPADTAVLYRLLGTIRVWPDSPCWYSAMVMGVASRPCAAYRRFKTPVLFSDTMTTLLAVAEKGLLHIGHFADT
jgi:hypothetical protein